MARFVYDKENLRFKLKKATFGSVLWTIFKYLFLSFSVAVAVYVVIALSFDTKREEMLSRENRALREQYAEMREKMNLVDKAVRNLELRDREIYNEVFNTDPPKYGVGMPDSLGWAGDLYDRREKDLIEESASRLERLERTAARVDGWIESTTRSFRERDSMNRWIPAIIPIKDFSLLQTGASVGKKINPFFKTIREHTGIDLLAPIGTEVICTAEGTVSAISKSGQSYGNRVTVSHRGGYVTTYSHLSVVSVRQGQGVHTGSMIGRVGVSGTTFAPCLHYEVIRNGKYQEPVSYFFADLTPSEYDEMFKVALTTGQSMD